MQPRLLRGTVLVTLYAVFESTVTEVAGFIQRGQGKRISLDEFKGNRNLLTWARKHFEDYLDFQLTLTENNERWKRLRLLSDLRNAIVHRNGRLDMIKKKEKKEEEEEKEKAGIKDVNGFLFVDEAFVKQTFLFVKDELEDLVERCKAWDTAQKA